MSLAVAISEASLSAQPMFTICNVCSAVSLCFIFVSHGLHPLCPFFVWMGVPVVCFLCRRCDYYLDGHSDYISLNNLSTFSDFVLEGICTGVYVIRLQLIV